MTAFPRASIELIPEWLAATRDLEIATGLSREEALVRARKLRHLIHSRGFHRLQPPHSWNGLRPSFEVRN